MSLLGQVEDKPVTPGRGLSFALPMPMDQTGAYGRGMPGISPLPPIVSRLPTPPEKAPVEKLKLPDSESEEDEPTHRQTDPVVSVPPLESEMTEEEALLGSGPSSPAGSGGVEDDDLLEEDVATPLDGDDIHRSDDGSRPNSTDPVVVDRGRGAVISSWTPPPPRRTRGRRCCSLEWKQPRGSTVREGTGNERKRKGALWRRHDLVISWSCHKSIESDSCDS